jgi:hypothetical protein
MSAPFSSSFDDFHHRPQRKFCKENSADVGDFSGSSGLP